MCLSQVLSKMTSRNKGVLKSLYGTLNRSSGWLSDALINVWLERQSLTTLQIIVGLIDEM